MSNLTLFSWLQRVGACNAAICIQIYDLLMTRRATDRQQDTERERDTENGRESGRERGARVVGRNTQHQATFHKAARREIHQNRAINYIIVHRVSGAGHSHDGLPVERYLDKGGGGYLGTAMRKV